MSNEIEGKRAADSGYEWQCTPVPGKFELGGQDRVGSDEGFEVLRSFKRRGSPVVQSPSY